MCRHLAWVGTPRSVASLVTEPEWSLVRQSYEPRYQDHGLINADGFGIAWYDKEIRPEPARYRRIIPIWNDGSLTSFAPIVHSNAILATVRSATVGMPVEETAAAPFARGRWSFSHNGVVGRDAVKPLLDADDEPESTSDAALLATVVLRRLDAGEKPGAVLSDVVTRVAAADTGGRLNLLVTDGSTIAATAWGASLSYLHGVGLACGGVLVASEPLDDDPRWVAVPDRSLVLAGPSGVQHRPLQESSRPWTSASTSTSRPPTLPQASPATSVRG